MVRRAFALLLCGTSCLPSSVPCGRGRCGDGTCVFPLETYVQRNEPAFDFWCVVPCPADRRCPTGQCLVLPNDSSVEVCAGDAIELKYTYGGDPIAFEDGTEVSLESFDVEPAHVDGGMLSCPTHSTCSAGWFSTGDDFPIITGHVLQGELKQLPFSGMPGAAYPPAESADMGVRTPIGPQLPTGLPIVIHVGGRLELQYRYAR